MAKRICSRLQGSRKALTFLEENCTKVHRLGTDITRFWFRDRWRYAWEQSPAAIGSTTMWTTQSKYHEKVHFKIIKYIHMWNILQKTSRLSTLSKNMLKPILGFCVCSVRKSLYPTKTTMVSCNRSGAHPQIRHSGPGDEILHSPKIHELRQRLQLEKNGICSIQVTKIMLTTRRPSPTMFHSSADTWIRKSLKQTYRKLSRTRHKRAAPQALPQR